MTDSGDNFCFHCGEAIAPGTHIYAQLQQQRAAMCCEGCRAVAELIAGVGLDDYYRYRREPALKPELKPKSAPDEWQTYAATDLAQQFIHVETDGQHSVVLLLEGVRCAACAWLIDRMLRRQSGITSVSVNTATSRTRVVWRADQCELVTVLRTLSQLGYRPQPLNAATTQDHSDKQRRHALKRLGVAGIGMMQVMMYVLPLYTRGRTGMDTPVAGYLQLVGLLLTTPVLFYSGWPFLSSAARALRHRAINMDVPVSLALTLAYFASVFNTLRGQGEVYFDSVTMFVFFLTLGRFIEMSVRHRTSSVTEALARLQPHLAHRVILDSQGERYEDIALAALRIHDEVLIRVGEAVPADGQIVSGSSSVDESLLTGEALPVRRQTGASVMAGTINVEAPLRMRVTAIGNSTVLAGVIALLQRAHADKPRVALLADRIARHFLNALLMLAMLVGIAWYWIDPTRAFDAVLAVLVVTCPCALSLATPAVIAAATTALAQRGLLVARADAIEQLAMITHVCFDKTGTLTTGRMAVTQTQSLSDYGATRCLQIAAALEQSSEHPIARAFRDEVAANVPSLSARELSVVTGMGVTGIVDGAMYRLGTPQFVAALRDDLATRSDAATIVLGDAQQELARFTLHDPLRVDARVTVKQLAALGVRSSILSGDAASIVSQVATDCAIDEFKSRQTPADKLHALQSLKRNGQSVAMVGDGINDAPVLGAASVSIAMGGGASLACASADIVLMSNSLSALPHAITLARRARRIMRQNLVWAAVYNLTAIPLAAVGMISPWLAAAGMSVSSVLVALNATRILRTPTATRQQRAAVIADAEAQVVHP